MSLPESTITDAERGKAGISSHWRGEIPGFRTLGHGMSCATIWFGPAYRMISSRPPRRYGQATSTTGTAARLQAPRRTGDAANHYLNSSIAKPAVKIVNPPTTASRSSHLKILSLSSIRRSSRAEIWASARIYITDTALVTMGFISAGGLCGVVPYPFGGTACNSAPPHSHILIGRASASCPLA